MMEQMLKLCMFLMRAKLTITEAAGRRVCVCVCLDASSGWTSLGSSPFALKVQSKIKKIKITQMREKKTVRVMSQS